MTTISLDEYRPRPLPRDCIAAEVAKLIWERYKNIIDIEWPSPKTADQWQLTSKGWVGYIPVSPELSLMLKPKVPLKNLFGMWEYAYRLDFFKNDFNRLYECQSLPEFYERLGNVLAKRVRDRCRKGYYRAYLSRTDQLSFIRGRIDNRLLIEAPWRLRLHCHYQENTADIDENRILAWTLFLIARSGLCTDRVAPAVRNAFHSLQHLVSLEPFRASDCLGRVYNRLNQDYQPIHALCRFFLDNMGPRHEFGDNQMLPFLVDMAALFESFVAEWLREHLPSDLEFKAQDPYKIADGEDLTFKIDMVLTDAGTGRTKFVLDTKYKADASPKADDIQQIVAYAEAKNCKDAILVYPTQLTRHLDVVIGSIRVRSLTFDLDGDLEEAGSTFLNSLFLLISINLLTEQNF